MQKYFFSFMYAKKLHGYAMQHIRNMMVDVGVPYTVLKIDKMMPYTDSEIETGRKSLRIMANERRRGVPIG